MNAATRTRLGIPSLIALVVVALVLLLAPLIFSEYFVSVILTKAIWLGIAAASLIFLSSYGGMVSLAQVGLYGVAGFTMANLVAADGGVAAAWTPWLAVIGGVLAATLIGLVFGAIASRSEGIYFLMLTLAFGQLLWELALNWTRVTGGSNGLFGIPQPALGTTDRALRGNDRFYWYALAVFLVGYGVLRMIVASPFGRALGAIRENEGRMSSLGYNVPLYKLAAFTIAGAVAGYAGALFLQQPKYFSPEGMSFEVSALAVVALIVGGQRSLLGPVLGAAFVYVIRDQLASVLAEHWRLVLGAVFVLVVYLLPGGFVAAGRAARRRVGARGAA
jgi:branched-chain amino acid transport system permease protein